MPSTSTLKHKCTYPGCKFAFVKRNHLDRHSRTHTNAQEFSCSQCQRKFSRLDSHNRHVQRLHPESVHELQGKEKPSRRRLTSQSHATVASDDDDEEVEDDMSQEVDSSHLESLPRQDLHGDINLDLQQLQHHHQYQHQLQRSESFTERPHLDAAEQLSSLRYYPPASIPSPIGYMPDATLISSPSDTGVIYSSPATSALSKHNTQPPNQTPPWSNTNAFKDDILDVDPIMCSLLWRTLEANIAEASGYSFLSSIPDWPSADVMDVSNLSESNLWDSSTHSVPVITSDQGTTTPVLNSNLFSESNSESRRNYGLPQMLQNLAASRQASVSAPNPVPGELPGPSRPGNGAAHMATQMKNDLYSVMRHIEAPVEPEAGLASSCLWLCRQHFLPHSSLTKFSSSAKESEDGHALVMNLIAIGSLCHRSEKVRKWGADIWKFTLRVVWSRGMRNVQDDTTASALMVILLSGHSYVLMSSDPSVNRLGRRAWLYCHVLRDHCYTKGNSDQEQNDRYFYSLDDQLESRLSLPEHRSILRRDTALLQKTWHQWYELEKRIRVAWDLCIYDSQQAAWLDITPSLQADVCRQQPEPALEELFEAKTAAEWLVLFEANIPKRRFAVFILKLLQKPFPCPKQHITWTTSQLASYNVIESIYSSWIMEKSHLGRTSEYWSNFSPINTAELGLLCSVHALANWRMVWSMDLDRRNIKDRYFLLIRWHCIHLNFCSVNVDIAEYIRKETKHLSHSDVDNEFLTIPKKKGISWEEEDTSVDEYFSSSRGRRAMWHAGQITAKLALLNRGASTPIHVAEAAYESTLLFVAFALVCKKKQEQMRSNSTKRCFELVGQDNKMDQSDQWADIGLAGFVSLDAETSPSYERVQQDWGGSAGSEARKWILQGDANDALIADLSIRACSMALQDLSRRLEEGRFLWCLAKDSTRLIDRGISLL